MGFDRRVEFYFRGEKEPLTRDEIKTHNLEIIERILNEVIDLWNRNPGVPNTREKLVKSAYNLLPKSRNRYQVMKRILVYINPTALAGALSDPDDVLFEFDHTLSYQIDRTCTDYHVHDPFTNRKSAILIATKIAEVYDTYTEMLKRG